MLVKQEFDPSGVSQHAPGAKLDGGKMRPWLMISGFSRALNAVADVTTKGAAKYTPGGWQHVENGSERYMEAFGRHALALGRGETVDDGPQGTGCLHKAQMIWNLLASLELELRADEAWERPKAAAPGVVRELTAKTNPPVPMSHWGMQVQGSSLRSAEPASVSHWGVHE